MSKYWDLYVLYIERCVRENYENDIDPAHYEMEWNHFWPQCIFGAWPVGQWLTLKQHAIATALQTLVFRENCMHGKHKQYLPPKLLELSWPYYCEARVKYGAKGAEIAHAKRDENGKSVNAVKAVTAAHKEKDENGRSIHAMKSIAKAHNAKNEDGKSLHGIKTSSITNSQMWMSTVDGYKSTAAGVSNYNRSRGWPGDARVRLS
jgi:hypothetical protein